jgi:hypothetical protein
MAAVLFSCTQTINSMEMSYAEKVKHGRPVIVGSGIEKISRYDAQDVDTILVQGGCHRDIVAGKYDRIKINFTQASDGQKEDVVIKMDDNIAPYMMVEQQNNQLKIDFKPLNETLKNSKHIEIAVALKKYARIELTHGVDVAFFSSVKADDLELSLSSEVSMKLPIITAKKLLLEVEDNVDVVVDEADKENTQIIADVIKIYNKGKAQVNFAINAGLLHVHTENKGVVVLSGVATKQDIVLFTGTFNGRNIQSKEAHIALCDGSGEMWVAAEHAVKGFCSMKSKHNTTYTMPDLATWLIYPRDSIKPIDFKNKVELS